MQTLSRSANPIPVVPSRFESRGTLVYDIKRDPSLRQTINQRLHKPLDAANNGCWIVGSNYQTAQSLPSPVPGLSGASQIAATLPEFRLLAVAGARLRGQRPGLGALTKFRPQADGGIWTPRRASSGNLRPHGKLVRTSGPTLSPTLTVDWPRESFFPSGGTERRLVNGDKLPRHT